MKKVNVLWLSLVAVVLFIALYSTSKTHAQKPVPQPPQTIIRVNKVKGNDIQVSGRILGFSCVTNYGGTSDCYVATAD